MEQFDFLLKELKETAQIQASGEWNENIPSELWEKYFSNSKYEKVADGLSVDRRRWYETSITVIKILDGFLGIRYITNLFSEMSDFEDCAHTMEFIKMKSIKSITYVADED